MRPIFQGAHTGDYFAAGTAGALRPVSGHNAFSLRVPVAIRSDAASRMATVSVAVTSTTGVFIEARSRCSPPRVVAQIANGLEKVISSYAGSGIAKLTLVEFTVRVAISRDEATGAERPQKPRAPDDRIMA